MDKPKPDFSLTDLVSGMREAMSEVDGYSMTTSEMCAVLGVSQSTIWRMLRKLHAAGTIETVRKSMVGIDSVSRNVTAYRLVQEEDHNEVDS